jgi:hypothetical protein
VEVPDPGLFALTHRGGIDFDHDVVATGHDLAGELTETSETHVGRRGAVRVRGDERSPSVGQVKVADEVFAEEIMPKAEPGEVFNEAGLKVADRSKRRRPSSRKVLNKVQLRGAFSRCSEYGSRAHIVTVRHIGRTRVGGGDDDAEPAVVEGGMQLGVRLTRSEALLRPRQVHIITIEAPVSLCGALARIGPLIRRESTAQIGGRDATTEDLGGLGEADAVELTVAHDVKRDAGA